MTMIHLIKPHKSIADETWMVQKLWGNANKQRDDNNLPESVLQY
jgi:hypothetical protein